jgi:hypothetical protein
MVLTFIVQGIPLAASLTYGREKLKTSTSSTEHPANPPNLATAPKLTAQAYDKIAATQEANEWDMAGHAQIAKDLLAQASQELKPAAEAKDGNK